MKRRLAVVSAVLPFLGLAIMADAVHAQDPPETQQLQERIRVLEERLNKLERIDVIKKTVEYVCPGGEISDEAPPGGRCSDGSRPLIRNTVRKYTASRREPISEKIDAAIQDANAKRVAVNGSARGLLQQVANAEEGQNQLFGTGSVELTLLYHPMVWTTLFIDFVEVRDGDKVLDVGCGTGSLATTLARVTGASKIVGIDPFSGFIDYARRQSSYD